MNTTASLRAAMSANPAARLYWSRTGRPSGPGSFKFGIEGEPGWQVVHGNVAKALVNSGCLKQVRSSWTHAVYRMPAAAQA